MGHHGKHIIDRDTGLCQICDQDAIREIHHGKAPPKHVYYSNHDDGLTHRSNRVQSPYSDDRYEPELDDERTPRRIRKIVRPAPTVRPRRVAYEDQTDQPVIVRRKVIRRGRSPSPEEDVIIRHSPPRSKPYYYVDREGQMVPQDYSPPPEPPRRYIVKSLNPSPGPTVRFVRRRVHTPPSSIHEIRSRRPKRLVNSDTEIIDRQHTIKHEDTFHPPTPQINPEMYHIVGEPIDDRYLTVNSPSLISQRDLTPSPKVIRHHDVEQRKPIRTDPIPRKIYNEPSSRRNLNEPSPQRRNLEHMPRRNPVEPDPSVPKRVNRRPLPGKSMPPDNQYNSNDNILPTVRNERKPPLPRRYVSTPQLTHNDQRGPESSKNSSMYYMRGADQYT